ncbi:MAG: transposase [Methylomagnum sp.]
MQDRRVGGGLGRGEPASSKKKGRAAQPSYGIIDSQSVKTQYGSEDRGIDGGKRVKGHKRHIVVDILGQLLHVQVHAANMG